MQFYIFNKIPPKLFSKKENVKGSVKILKLCEVLELHRRKREKNCVAFLLCFVAGVIKYRKKNTFGVNAHKITKARNSGRGYKTIVFVYEFTVLSSIDEVPFR